MATTTSPATGTPSEYAASELPPSVAGDGTPVPVKPAAPTYPPYPPYKTTPAPPSVAETIFAGKKVRLHHKNFPLKPARPPPKPAKPRGPKVTDVKMSQREWLAHARCLRKHGVILTDRLERMSRPTRRQIIYMWRQYADTLPAETINRLRNMLDADEPFKPDQAYAYFVNLRKSKKKCADKARSSQAKKNLMALCGDRKFVWARNATVAFARGIQQRLSRPGAYVLADGMLRLSNIILEEICNYMHMRPPSRRTRNPKSKFMLEMADKVAVWIDEILSESDERMLMMDFDEDEVVERADEPVVYDLYDTGYADDFLNMMAGKGGRLVPPKPAYLKFKGDMAEAFKVLTDAMYKKGNKNLVTHGKFQQTYKDAADELRQAKSFDASDYEPSVADEIKNNLASTVKALTPPNIANAMKDILDICSKYLAQFAEFSKDKGPAFHYLVKKMKDQPDEILYQKEKVKKTMAQAAKDLEEAKGLTSDHDDPNLSQSIYSSLSKLVHDVASELKSEMDHTLDLVSKYLSQNAVDENERGPAFDVMINVLENHGGKPFMPGHPYLATNYNAAHALKNAPGLTSSPPDPVTAPAMKDTLHREVDPATPHSLTDDMKDVIKRAADYLSGFARDRAQAKEILVKTMKDNGNKEAAKRNNVPMTYGDGAREVETSPTLTPVMPMKNIGKEMAQKVDKDVAVSTPRELKGAMKTLVNDATGEMSQNLALKSGEGGDRYPVELLSAAAKTLGDKPLFKTGPYGMTYAEAADNLKHTGTLEHDPAHEALSNEIATEFKKGIGTRLTPDTTNALAPTVQSAARHLAKVGNEAGEALTHLLNLMSAKGDAPFAKMQGYDQTYADAVRKIVNAPSLGNDKVDKGTYETIRSKLKDLINESPEASKYEKTMPDVIETVSKFLADPAPESHKEKQKVLGDLLAKKGDEVLHEDGMYKITYGEAAKEIQNAKPGGKPLNEQKKNQVLDKMDAAIEHEGLKGMLKDQKEQGAAHVANVTQGRGEALGALHGEMKKKGDVPLADYKGAKMTHSEAADKLATAPHFVSPGSPPGMADKVETKLKQLPTKPETPGGKEELGETTKIAANYIAGQTAEQGGFVPAAGPSYGQGAAGGGGGGPGGGPGGVGGGPGGGPGGVGGGGPGSGGGGGSGPGGVGGGGPGSGVGGGPGGGPGGVGGGGLGGGPGGIGGGGPGGGPGGVGGGPGGGPAGAGGGAGGVGGSGWGPGGTGSGAGGPGGAGGGPGGTGSVALGPDGKPLIGQGGVGGAGGGPGGGPGATSGAGAVPGEGGQGWGPGGSGGGAGGGLGAVGGGPGGGPGGVGGGPGGGPGVGSGAGGPGGAGGGAGGTGSVALGPDGKPLSGQGGESGSRGPESEQQRKERLRKLEEARRLGGADPEHDAATKILHQQLKAKGNETFYQQPQTVLSHAAAADILADKTFHVDQTVKDSADTDRLARKFERKLSSLVQNVTPNNLREPMTDVVIESSRGLSEYFVSKNYMELVKDGLVAEMQKHGNEILIDTDNGTESFFYAAQRLKKAKSFETNQTCKRIAFELAKKLEECVKCRTMARKLTGAMKEHVKGAANYLSAYVTKPDENIDAYVALINEMEAAGDNRLVEGNIPMSYKECANYLKQLTSTEDQIRMPNAQLQSDIENKLKNLMANTTQAGLNPAVLAQVITEQTRLLVSYIMLQDERTKALKYLVEKMEQVADNLLLRHGSVRKTYFDAIELLEGKNTDQLGAQYPDPVAARKIQIKLFNLMRDQTPEQFKKHMDSVLEDVTNYLAVHLLRPQVIKVCKCMKSVFVQCELWCEEILRRVAKPCCTCSRHVSAQALGELSTPYPLRFSPSQRHAFAPGLDISVTQCPSQGATLRQQEQSCPAIYPPRMCPHRPTDAYFVHTTTRFDMGRGSSPTRLLATQSTTQPCENRPTRLESSLTEPSCSRSPKSSRSLSPCRISVPLSERALLGSEASSSRKTKPETDSNWSFHTSFSRPSRTTTKPPFFQAPVTMSMYATIHDQNVSKTSCLKTIPEPDPVPNVLDESSRCSSPVVTTDQMSDLHAMMVSLMWNVQAWKDWLQENIDHALNPPRYPDLTDEEAHEKWVEFRKRVTTEALQWRQYNIFSRQLTLRLALRYRDKQIVSPTRATIKTRTYVECQQEMLEIIDMFSKWTLWLMVILKETENMEMMPSFEVPQHEACWSHFKRKVEGNLQDWVKYNTHLKVCWERKYNNIISDWVPSWKQVGPVWVVSACGAVPSGAVSAGEQDGELIWVARTTHRSEVLPAALVPSKHCCMVYADGGVHRYTKYQVMCNAEVKWIAWRAEGGTGAGLGRRAVRVAPGVHVGRVLYRGSHLLGAVLAPHHRCHVIIYGRPFAFTCYELLILAPVDPPPPQPSKP